MKTCWAASLGDCSDTISGEHIITEGVHTTDTIRVKGLPWCVDDFKTIGLASFVRNVLCTSHNSRLSDADAAAIQLRDALCESASLSEARKAMPPQDWEVKRLIVNGGALERWCLKTLITIAFGGHAPIGGGDSQPGTPSRTLVKIAFGLEQFQSSRAGLHWMGDTGDTISVTEGVVVTTFLDHVHRLAGARFWFWGLTFVLVLDDGPTGPFGFTSLDRKKTIQPTTVHRPRKLGIGVHGRESHSLEFVW
jgi:hypothetical protein